jgi:hypothetical protein
MDLRKGSEVKEGKRRCFRCSGRKKMYQLGKTAVWTHDNSGGVLKDCPLCCGTGLIDKTAPKIDEEKIEELKDGKKRRSNRKTKEVTSFEKEY